MTRLLYLDDSYRFEAAGEIIDILPTEDGRHSIILDQTIFYPQGGGQPYDKGTIAYDDGGFDVEEVRLIDGTVHHIGHFLSETIPTKKSPVTLAIDPERRKLHARLHSGGHMIDIGVRQLDQPLRATKGYHFPVGSYVEFEGDIEPEKQEDFRLALEKSINKLISSGNTVKAQLVDRDKLSQYSLQVPDNIPTDKPSRVVTVYGELGHPCGGTHVKDIKEIGQLCITKLKSKNGTTRISYELP